MSSWGGDAGVLVRFPSVVREKRLRWHGRSGTGGLPRRLLRMRVSAVVDHAWLQLRAPQSCETGGCTGTKDGSVATCKGNFAGCPCVADASTPGFCGPAGPCGFSGCEGVNVGQTLGQCTAPGQAGCSCVFGNTGQIGTFPNPGSSQGTAPNTPQVDFSIGIGTIQEGLLCGPGKAPQGSGQPCDATTYVAAWYNGQPYDFPTFSAKLAVHGQSNPCSVPFTIDGVSDLTFQGCGATPL